MVSERAYLDHAATTQLRPEALEAYTEAARILGNPSSQHSSGRKVRGIYDDALADIAELIGVPRSWIIMTSGGTEADNIALRGVRGRVVGCATDHPAVIDTVRALDGDLAPVKADGRIDAAALDALLNGAGRDDQKAAVLVSAALVNNETGIIQDLDSVIEVAQAHGTIVHTDAVQGVGHVELPEPSRVPLMSITGHKIGAPVGVGMLVADPAVTLHPSGTGGGQQRGIRSGTLDAPHAAALAAALRATIEKQEDEIATRDALAARLREGIREIDPTAVFTAEGSPHSSHVTHVCFPGADQDAALFVLDSEGVDCSAGSACHAGVTQASHVLTAMGVSDDLMRGALRFSLGYTSTETDVDKVLAALPKALDAARKLGVSLRR